MKRIAVLWILMLGSVLGFAQNAKMVFFVRHAEKVSEAKDALLSEAGRVRARCLSGVLADAGIQKIITSDVVRTQQTAQPLADRLQEKLTILPAADIGRFAEQIRNAEGNSLVVAHSDTLPEIIHQLTGKTVTIGSNEYNGMFIVSFNPNPTAPVVLHVCTPSEATTAPRKMAR